jgi:hypothetical protein
MTFKHEIIAQSVNQQDWKCVCTVWSRLKLLMCSSCHITGTDISRATKEITNAIMMLKATMVSNVIAIM